MSFKILEKIKLLVNFQIFVIYEEKRGNWQVSIKLFSCFFSHVRTREGFELMTSASLGMVLAD
jgi:hypothetical protein